MNKASSTHFDQQYQRHLKHLKLKGLQPKTIEAYARAIRRIGKRFDGRIDHLTEPQIRRAQLKYRGRYPPVSGLLSSKLNPYVGLTGWGRGRYEGEVSEGSEGAGGGEDDGAEE